MESTSITIEQVTKFSQEAADAIKKLAPQLGKNYKQLTDSDIHEMIDSPHTSILVAREQKYKQIVGMITLIVYRIPYVRKAYVDDLIVDISYRGMGAGSQLLEKAVTLAQQKGAAYIDFTARPRREASNHLYEKLGFEKRETNVYRRIFTYGEL